MITSQEQLFCILQLYKSLANKQYSSSSQKPIFGIKLLIRNKLHR
jgi:hypothetical protein